MAIEMDKDVDNSSLQVDSRSKSSSDELCELSLWLCHNDSIINSLQNNYTVLLLHILWSSSLPAAWRLQVLRETWQRRSQVSHTDVHLSHHQHTLLSTSTTTTTEYTLTVNLCDTWSYTAHFTEQRSFKLNYCTPIHNNQTASLTELRISKNSSVDPLQMAVHSATVFVQFHDHAAVKYNIVQVLQI